MKKFIVNSAILSSNLDPMACAIGAPKMLMNAKIKDVKITSCYCCGAEGRSVFVVEAETREALLEAMNKVNIPVASVMEAEEVKPKM
jgi:nitrate reductase NapAB chaperone NapD